MKKLFALLLIAFAAVTLTAAETAYQFPGWKCTDEAKLAASLAAANKWQKPAVLVLQELAKTPAKTYDELCAIIDKAVDASDHPDKVNQKITLKKQFPYCRNEFIAEAWAFCQKNPTTYDFYYVAYKAKQLNLTDSQVYLRLRDYLLGSTPDAATARRGVDAFLNVAVTVDGSVDISVKDDLKKLNRKFSKNLLDDKAAWEPVIAKIRTTLETY